MTKLDELLSFHIISYFNVALFLLSSFNIVLFLLVGDRGSTVVKVLRYKSKGRWFDYRWCHWNFSLT